MEMTILHCTSRGWRVVCLPLYSGMAKYRSETLSEQGTVVSQSALILQSALEADGWDTQGFRSFDLDPDQAVSG